MFKEIVFKWLDIALIYGLSEFDFWKMTIAELERWLKAQKQIELNKQKEKANFDFLLADLIGRSVARVYSDKSKYPDISEVYPWLFDKTDYEKREQEKRTELSIIRFREFANSYNKKFEKEVANKE